MTDLSQGAVQKLQKTASFLHFAKTVASLLAILGGLQTAAPARAASQDSLRPRSSTPSLLDPQSNPEDRGFVATPKPPITTSTKSTPDQTRIHIRAIKLIGHTVYTTSELLGILAEDAQTPLVPDDLSFDEIQSLANKITEFYRKNGYLVGQAVLPQQDVTDGTLTIRIIEGRLDQVITAPNAWNTDNKLVESFHSAYRHDQKPMMGESLTRALAIAGETTGNINRATLQPSAMPGGSELVISTQRLPMLFYGFTADNMGNASTGEYRLNNYIGGNSWLADGDYTRFEFGTSNEYKRSNRFDLTYSIPVSLDGWSASARAWSTQYNLGGVFASTKSTGSAQAGEVAVTYALQRDNAARSDWKTGYSYITLVDKINKDNSNRNRHMQTAWTTLNGFTEDDFLRTRARNTYSLNATLGNLAFDDANAARADSTGAKTKGTFGLVSVSGSREQILFDSWSIYGFVRGQTASTNLDSYNKMSLGGSSAVRAYAGGEAAGDKAAIGTTELRYLYAFNLFEKESAARLAAFYDVGWSQFNTPPIPSSTPTSNTATRGGYGLELNVFWATSIGWQLFWAHTADDTRISQVDGKRSRYGTSLSGSF